MDLSFNIESHEDEETVAFNGHINEDAEVALAGLKKQVNGNAAFNFREVKSVNSCGVRAWINFIRELDGSQPLYFDECTPEVVSQINMIPNFRGHATVRSVYASYVCDNCDHEHLELFKQGENMPTSPDQELRAIACPKCGEVMEMEELESEFFGWLGSEG